MEARLKTGLWVKALIRRCDLNAIGVAVAARGDADAGAVLLKFLQRDNSCRVLAQARRPDGSLVWMCATGAVHASILDTAQAAPRWPWLMAAERRNGA